MEGSAEVKAQIIGLSAWYRPLQTQEMSFMTPNPPRPIIPQPDPDYIQLHLILAEVHGSDFNIVVKKDEIKRMNVSVGDYVKVNITSEKQISYQ